MLPRNRRARTSAEFAQAVRRGRRAGGPTLVLHLTVPVQPPGSASLHPARVGFVVGRAVGGAVVRNRVRRRLRHLMAGRLHRLPPGSTLVVRATPAAAGCPTVRLAEELDRLLGRLLRQAAGSGLTRGPAGEETR